MWWRMFIGALIAIGSTILIRILFEKNDRKILSTIIKKFRNCILCIVSIDYFMAEIQKKKYIPKNNVKSQELSQYIKKFNQLNLVISFILVVAIFISLKALDLGGWRYILAGIMSYRLVSRTTEINVSFIKDIIDDGEKKSSLFRGVRIKLAFISLIEEAVLFSGIYMILIGVEKWWCPILGGLHSFVISQFQSCGLLGFVSLYQVFCSIVLITLAFASYIGKDKEVPELDSHEDQ